MRFGEEVWKKIPHHSYWLTIKRYSMWMIGFVLLSTSATAIYQHLKPDEYVCTTELLPPDIDLLPVLKIQPGQAVDLERFITYLESEELYRELRDTFNLISYYELHDISDEKERYLALLSKIERNFVFKITKNGTISISVYDKNPLMSYEILNFLIRRIHNKVIEYSYVQKNYSELTYQMVQISIVLDSLLKRIETLRSSYKIVGYPDLSGGAQLPYQVMLQNPRSFEALDEIIALESQIRRYINLREDFRKQLIDIEGFFRVYRTYRWLLYQPQIPIAPARPKRLRWIISAFLASTASSLFLILYLHKIGLIHPRDYKEDAENPEVVSSFATPA
ncbi:MAG: hypothetical protein NZ580_02105 [Bacteroidia bacterium]|nr:hypothetical protein [Bacteroidia bacterium]MDW8235763.1 hypothetical protein [Bacteroidia bacterium]